jgi:catechol 2,3-dioxygenase-like lactoylglutathione lyase family enzyme
MDDGWFGYTMPPSKDVQVLPSARLVPELYCAELARSLRFYVEVLGFDVLYTRMEESFAYLQREGAELMLEEPRGRVFLAGPLQYPYGRGINLQIEVADVAELFAAVQRSRSPIVLPLEDRWYRRDDSELGNRQFVVQDPDGYLLRFFQSLGSRPYAAG